MIEKLNFSGAGANMNIESPQSSIGDSLLTLGKYFTQKDSLEQEKLRQQEKDLYQRGRDAITDARHDEQQLKADAEKNRLIGKEINTANAMQAIYNPDEYKSLRMSAEQKAIQDTLANADPVLKSQIQSELKGYDPKASGQQWVDTALSQSNVDSSKIADLRMDMDKQRIQEEQFAENKRLKERELLIQAENARQARQDRIDSKNESLKHKPKYEQFYDKNGNVATVDTNDPVSLDKASEAGFYSTGFIKLQGRGSKDGSSSGSESGVGSSFFNKDKKDYVTNINYSSIGKDQQKKLDELSASTFKGTTGEKKEVINFLDKVDSVSKAAKLSKNEAEELVDLATGSSFGSEINLDKGVLDARYGKEVFATPDGTITKADALYNAFNRPETFKIVSIPQEGGKPDKKVFLDLTLTKHKTAFDQYSGEEAKKIETEAKKIKETIVKKPIDSDRLNNTSETIDTKGTISTANDDEIRSRLKKAQVDDSFLSHKRANTDLVQSGISQSDIDRVRKEIEDEERSKRLIENRNSLVRQRLEN